MIYNDRMITIRFDQSSIKTDQYNGDVIQIQREAVVDHDDMNDQKK